MEKINPSWKTFKLELISVENNSLSMKLRNVVGKKDIRLKRAAYDKCESFQLGLDLSNGPRSIELPHFLSNFDQPFPSS